jgi:predicted ArsR family transcriptional regulator
VPPANRPQAQVADALSRAEREAAHSVAGLLRRRLGTAGMLRVLGAVAWGRVQGEPWKPLGPAADERDRLCRRQLGDLVLLDRAVASLIGAAAAREIAREAVLAGALPFLDALIPPLPAARLAEAAEALTRCFFNAEGRAVHERPDRFQFHVSRCRFVELLGRVGAAHLAPLFCEADRAFFDSGARPLTLTRTRTLAEGADSCDFQFTVA